MQDTSKNLYKKLLGILGENKATKFLKKKGYNILERNYKRKTGEIDIIAQDNEAIVFIEVKTRSNADFGTPAEAVDERRIKRYINTANEYLVSHDLLSSECRFDVIEVLKGEINHIKNAFSA